MAVMKTSKSSGLPGMLMVTGKACGNSKVVLFVGLYGVITS